MKNLMRLRHLVVVCLLAVAALTLTANDAFATHFRYGTITWTVPNPAQPNVINVRFDSVWRWSFPYGQVAADLRMGPDAADDVPAGRIGSERRCLDVPPVDPDRKRTVADRAARIGLEQCRRGHVDADRERLVRHAGQSHRLRGRLYGCRFSD